SGGASAATSLAPGQGKRHLRRFLLLSRALLGLRMHVGPVELLLDPVERVVSDDAARAQLDQLAPLRLVRAAQRVRVHRPVVRLARCGWRQSVGAAQSRLVPAGKERGRPVFSRGLQCLETRARRFRAGAPDLVFDGAVVLEAEEAQQGGKRAALQDEGAENDAEDGEEEAVGAR